jgi:hypothetical protein
MPSRNLPRHIVSHKKHIGEFMDEKHIKHALDTKSSLISGGLDPKTKKYAFVYCLSCDEGRNEFSKQAVKTFYTGDTSHRKLSPQCFTDESFDKIKKYFEKPGKIKPKAEPKEKPKEEAKEEAKAEPEKTNEIITDISDKTKKSLEDWYSEYHKDDEPDSDEEEPNFEDKILEIIKVHNSMMKYAKKRNEELEKIKEETKGVREKNLLIEEQKEKIKDLEKQVRLLKYDAELMEKHLP